MAKHNPFSIFRRNQRAWMAGLTLFTMFSFIALGSMVQCVGTRNRGEGPQYIGDVASTQKFGKLDYNGFLDYRAELVRLEAFTRNLMQISQEERAYPSYDLMALQAQLFYCSNDGEQTVNRWLITKYAEKEGLFGDKEAATDYLKRLSQITVFNFDSKQTSTTTTAFSSEQLTRCMRAAGLTESILRDLLRKEIGFERYVRKYDAGSRMSDGNNLGANTIAQSLFGHGASPLAAADYLLGYQAVNTLVKAKVASFDAADYVAEVKEPSNSETKDLYEQYKNIVFRADSARPGFTQPAKLAFEVARVEITDETLDAISDEDVKQYYEEHKEEFRRPTPPKANEDATAPAKESISLDADAPSLDVLPEDALKAFDSAPEAPAADAAPAPEAPATEAPAAEAPAEGAAVTREAPLFAAYQQEAEEAPAAEQPAEAAEATEEPAAEQPAEAAEATEAPAAEQPAETAEATEEPAAEQPAETAEATEEPAADQPAEAAEATEEPAAEQPAEAAEATEEPAAEQPAEAAEATEEPAEASEADSEFFPLEMVEAVIRRRIAAERIEAKMGAVREQLLQDFHKSQEVKGDEVFVPTVDLKKLAEENGLQYAVTTRKDAKDPNAPALVSHEEATLMDILPSDTLSQIYDSLPLRFSPQRVGVYNPTENPQQLYNVPSAFFVYRALESKNQYLPEFDEAKDDVVKAWKLQKAFEIANTNAKEFYEKASKEGADFDALAAEAKAHVVETEKFTWFTSSMGPYGSYLQLGEVRELGVEIEQSDRDNKEIVAPGLDFYETVYSLDQGGIGICENQSKDRVFVIKVVDKPAVDPNEFDSIAEDSTAADAARQIANLRLETFHQNMIEKLRKDAGFKWISVPHVEINR